ncbi:MAG: N-acetylmuramoyl-L-alanine amidase [Syntrophobacterales bacterium]|nr:MAG: N-acetylmuramoyl-L-alanine amidase [Syntrophobacterales bacterium]
MCLLIMFSKGNPYWLAVLGLVVVFWPCASSTSTIRLKCDLSIKRIAIDPGFGGKDFGAPGYIEGVYSKNINLAITKKLAKKVRDKLNVEVIMTRESDEFIPLEERVAIANLKKVPLFISIHCNAYRDQRVYGIETYYLNFAADEEASKVQVLNDNSSKERMSDLEKILSDLMPNEKIDESRRLADHVQKSLYEHMNKKYSHIKDRGVKQAPFYVLIGTQMPSILIATSFISNPRECKRSISDTYQDDFAESIIRGIQDYAALPARNS